VVGTMATRAPRKRAGGKPTSPHRDVEDVVTVIRGRRTLSETVLAQLRRLILEGHLPAGAPLRLQALADRFGVSVMPVREAIRQLEAEDLVTFTPHRGARVARLSFEDIEELYVVRAAVEGFAARKAAERLTSVDGREIQACFDRLEEAGSRSDLEAFLEADRAFHRRIYAASGRPQLVDRIADLVDRSRRAHMLAYGPWRQHLRAGIDEHRHVLDAVLAQDTATAERLTFEHIRGGGNRILEALEQLET
jgi:DNA-binding GntR family transcriptional regulator